MILSAKNLPEPPEHHKWTFQVRVTALEKCPSLSVHTEKKEASDKNEVEWNHGIAMEAEQGTKGLQLELLRIISVKRQQAKTKAGCFFRGSRKKSQVGASTYLNSQPIVTSVGKVCIYWAEVDIHGSKRISKSLDISNAEIEFCISATKFLPAPKLFRALHSPVTDDNHNKVSLSIEKGAVPQQGRWTTKTVVNHNGKPIYKIRQRFVTRHI